MFAVHDSAGSAAAVHHDDPHERGGLRWAFDWIFTNFHKIGSGTRIVVEGAKHPWYNSLS